MSIKVYAFKAEYRGAGENVKRLDWVNIGPVGLILANTTWYRISDVKPKDGGPSNDTDGSQARQMKARWALIEPHYQAWMEGQELPSSGTPVAAWGGITKEVADVFVHSGVKTVEEISLLKDSELSRISVPNIRQYIAAAKLFLDSAGGLDTNNRIESLERSNQELADQLKAATELLEQMTKKPKAREAA
jgi:hypothetical protein